MKIAIIDRDGTIIEDTHYPRDPELVSLIEGACEGLRLIGSLGYQIFVVSNQSGVGRKIISMDAFHAVHARFKSLLEKNGVVIDEFFYCLHAPEENCDCRKPKTKLIPTVYKNKPIDFSKSFVVGDRLADLELSKNLGAKGFLVLSGYGKTTLEEIKNTSHSFQIKNSLDAVAKHIRNL